ncbi:MAG: O-acyltransferase [Gemmatimonadota bacterium]|nr:MAG: O-acyltransferase [Gemmatimonadota bacterium]
MLFNSLVFLLFLAVVFPLYLVLPGRARTAFLVLASYFFYGYWDWRFLSLLWFSTVLDFFIGRALARVTDPGRRKALLAASLAGNLGVLAFFKYFNFFIGSFEAATSALGMPLDFLHLNILLPVGISFYTFQTLSYTIDVYRGKLAPTNSLLDFALYVAFFPQLVAGPIERATHLLPQIARLGRPTRDDCREALALIGVGMFKKVLVGDTCGRIVDQVFAAPMSYTSSELMMGLVLFSVQIYADFSGYSSIARGTARLFGVDLMENFNQPYLAASITEFWRRWHISLSSWLRDYLYVPLGGNRKGPARTYVNLFATMLLGGLWHGAHWTFVFWGGLHGLYLAVHKWMLGSRRPAERFVPGGPASTAIFIGKVLATNALVLLTWLFFRAPDFGTAFRILGKFVQWTSGPFDGRILVVTATYVIVTLVIDLLEYTTRDHAFLLRVAPRYRWGIYAGMWATTLLYLFQATPMPFIYFQF